jgi:hypothetical protein
MNAHRRTALKPALQLETLDERIAPAHLGIAAAGHAAVASHHIAVHSRAAVHVHSSAMHTGAARAAAMANHHGRIAGAASNAVVPVSTGRIVGSTMPATLTAAHTAARPASVLLGSMTRVHVTRSATMPPSPVSVAPPAPTTTTPPITITAPPAPTAPTTSTAPATLPASLPANADNNLNTIYQQYLQFVNSGGTGTFSSSLSNLIEIQGTSVGVQVHGNGTGDFNAMVSALESAGMQVTATDAVTQTVVGMMPIANLPATAQGQQTLSVTPQYRPVLF